MGGAKRLLSSDFPQNGGGARGAGARVSTLPAEKDDKLHVASVLNISEPGTVSDDEARRLYVAAVSLDPVLPLA